MTSKLLIFPHFFSPIHEATMNVIPYSRWSYVNVQVTQKCFICYLLLKFYVF